MIRKQGIHFLARPIAVLGLAVPGASDEAPLFPSDRRLDQSVTLTRPRVYLGEAVEELSRAAGVALSVSDERGPVDGIQLTFLVRERAPSGR